MLNFSSYLICSYTYLFLFLMAYNVPKYKDVLFFVNFTKRSEDGMKEVVKYREFFSVLSIVLFIISVVITEFTGSIFYLSSLIAFYIVLMLFKFLEGNREILKLRNQIPVYIKQSVPFIKIKKIHYILHIFTVFYMFLSVYKLKGQNPFSFKNSYYISPVTALFVSGIFFISYLIIKNAPDFANKDLKKLITNYIFIVSYTVLFILLSFNTLILYRPGYLFFIYTLLFTVVLFFINIYFLFYIKNANKPFEFKVENPHISSDNLIEISADGTRIFLNFKNKKTYLISAGLFICIIIYILLVYKLII